MTDLDVPPMEPEPSPIKWYPCECGGVITAPDNRRMPEAVAVHQQEARHLLWRLRRNERNLYE